MVLILKPEVLCHVTDVHCHPTDALTVSSEAMQQLEITICAMSSMKSDQQRVAGLASRYPNKVIPCFGYHPWFSHLISVDPVDKPGSKEDHYRRLFFHKISSPEAGHLRAFNELLPLLPEPTPLSVIVDDVRSNLLAFPEAMIGEVGLDRVFRVPFDYFAEERKLTPFTIPLDHQLTILEAQFELAIELGRNVSVHSVKSQQATVELLAKLAKKHGDHWYNISIDMHSCGFSPETWRNIEKKISNVFFSLSTAINGRHSNLKKLLESCSPGRILVESDYHNVERCTERTLEMVELVAEAKGWAIEEEWLAELEKDKWGAIRRLEANWMSFKQGKHAMAGGRKKHERKFKLLESDSEIEVGHDA